MKCVVCDRELLVHERPQRGLPPVCDHCARACQLLPVKASSSFDLFELLHAIGVQLGLVSTTGSRLQLLEDRSAELQQLREFYGPRRDAGS